MRHSLYKLQQTQGIAEALASDTDNARRLGEDLQQQIQELERQLVIARFNVMDLWGLKQGQVEYPQAAVVTDYSHAVLIDRNRVEELNGAIRTLAKQKLDALREMKNYRRGILALDWECQVLDFQADDVALRTRDIQLLRVTKTMQEYIRSGDDAAAAAQIETLERQLEHADSGFLHKRDERMKLLRRLKSQYKATVDTTAKLQGEAVGLERVVDDRRQLHSMHRGGGTTTGPDPLKAIYSRSRLADLIRAQAADIDTLEGEVLRWKQKTEPIFPYLAPGRTPVVSHQNKKSKSKIQAPP
jgi:chromosome segregation ATPase